MTANENYTPKKGDRVRVVLEGEVELTEEQGFWVGSKNYSNYISESADHVVSVELVKPALQVGWHRANRPGNLTVQSMYWDGKSWRYNEDPGSVSGYDWVSLGYLGTGVDV